MHAAHACIMWPNSSYIRNGLALSSVVERYFLINVSSLLARAEIKMCQKEWRRKMQCDSSNTDTQCYTENEWMESKKIYLYIVRTKRWFLWRLLHHARRMAYAKFNVAELCSPSLAHQPHKYFVNENLRVRSENRRRRHSKKDTFKNIVCGVQHARVGGKFISASSAFVLPHSLSAFLYASHEVYMDECLCQSHTISFEQFFLSLEAWKQLQQLSPPVGGSMNTNLIRLEIKRRKFLCSNFNSLYISFVQLENQ